MTKKKSDNNLVNYLPHFLSALALVVSIIVGYNQIKTNNTIRNENIIQRNLINTANFDNENMTMFLLPYSDDFKLLDNKLFYPLKGKISTKVFDKTDNHTPIADIDEYITEIIRSNKKIMEHSGIFVDYTGYPILISTKYIFEGKINEVVGLYYVAFYAYINEQKDVDIKFKNIEFIKNMYTNENAAEYLMAVFYRNFKRLKEL